jgi:hypothetical protein
MIISVVCGRTKKISLCLLKYEIKSPFLIYSHVVNSVLFWLILWALNELMACVASINWITIYYLYYRFRVGEATFALHHLIFFTIGFELMKPLLLYII